MFAWFWEFLYMLAKTLFRLIDGLILCANKLCGIDPISFDGEEMDLMSYLLFSDEVAFAFRTTALLATVLVVVFTVFMIIRTITKDKAEGTPSQLAVKAFRTLLTFFFVPAVIIAFVLLGNILMGAIYSATMQTAASPGAVLFAAFAEDGGMSPEIATLFRTGNFDYNDTDLVWEYMELSNFPFLFAWITAGVVFFNIGSSMLIFVDRVLSLVILYIVAPISISTSVLDDGARFKLWRDQFLTKFIMGYGMIIAVNIYAMVCTLVMRQEFTFFEDASFLDLLMKLLIIAGGAFTMQKAMALIGNLVSAGAGSNELRDNAFSAGRLAGIAGSIANNTLGLLPRAGKSILGDALSLQSKHLASRLLRGVGLDGGYARKKDKKDGEGSDGDSDSKNGEKAKYGSDPNSTKNAIADKGFKTSWKGGEGSNSNNDTSKKGGGNNLLANTINGGGTGNKSNGGGDK